MWVDHDTSVSIATRYGPGIEFQWGAKFFAPVQTSSEAHSASYTMGTRSFPGLNRRWSGVDHPSPYSAEVKETVKLYLYSTSGPSWSVVG